MVRKLKIIHFVSGLGNDGVTQVIKNYTSKLNDKYDVDEIVAYQHHTDSQKLAEIENIGNRTYELPYKSIHPFKNLLETYRLIKNERPDIVHAHMSLLSFYPLFVAKLLGVKVRIAHAHIAQDNVKPKLAKIFKKLTLLFANHYIACGEAAGKYLFDGKKFQIIYNAIDQEKFKFDLQRRNRLREKLNISKETIILGTLGRLTEQKNQSFLIDIFNLFNQRYPNSKLIIIGVGELEKQLKDKANLLQCSKNIIFISGTSDPASYYSLFDYFLLPSLYEGLPVSAVEAQSSGVNTILSNNIDQDVKYNSNVIFVPIDHGEKPWISAIQTLKFNKRSKIKESNNYNINQQYPKLYQIYREYLNI